MASIRKRGNKWQAQVRRGGARPVSRSFHQRADAERWARQVEAAIERGDHSALDQNRAKYVSCLLSKYASEVTPSKRGASEETYRINAMLRDRIAEIPLSRLRSQAIADYRDRRLASVSAPSVRRELVILRHVFEVSRREWNSGPRHNPVAEIRMPSHAKSREMRLLQAEYADLLRGADGVKAWWLKPIIQIAVETAMRRGEILNARWIDLNLNHRTLRIPLTKNGEAREIPLSIAALNILKTIPQDGEFIFPVSANALQLAWQRLKKQQGMPNLRFHDLRHEAISRLFERGLSLPEVTLISGHKDPRMLMRYTHLRAEELAKKLG